jgi:hypothetical protein
MAARLPAFLPKIGVFAVVGLLATAGLTYAAEQQIASAPAPAAGAAPVQKRAVLIVPDLTRQAFVFAKGSLQDAGFSWKVAGATRGFAANVVAGQLPAPGTRVYDTGAPLVTLTLKRNSKYPQAGAPEDISPFRATPVQLVNAVKAPTAPATPPAVKQAVKKPAPAAKPAPRPAKAEYPQSRPAAFTVAGAPKEPLDEMPLVDRANALGRWLAQKPKPTDANVHHWLYQNEWIVTGAKFGWWRGAEALRKLIVVDRRAVKLWGIGSKSKGAAARALAEVETRSK